MQGSALAFLAAAILLVGSAGAADPGATASGQLAEEERSLRRQRVRQVETGQGRLRARDQHLHSGQNAVLTEGSVGSTDDYKFKWFRGNEDISHDVQTSGYEFGLPAEAKRKFRVQIKPRVDHPGTACLYSNVSVDTPPLHQHQRAFVALHKANGCVP